MALEWTMYFHHPLENSEVSRPVPCDKYTLPHSPFYRYMCHCLKGRNCKKQTTTTTKQLYACKECLSWRLTCSGKACLTLLQSVGPCATPTREPALALINGHVYQGHRWFLVEDRVCFLLTAVFPAPSCLRNTWQMNEWHPMNEWPRALFLPPGSWIAVIQNSCLGKSKGGRKAGVEVQLGGVTSLTDVWVSQDVHRTNETVWHDIPVLSHRERTGRNHKYRSVRLEAFSGPCGGSSPGQMMTATGHLFLWGLSGSEKFLWTYLK